MSKRKVSFLLFVALACSPAAAFWGGSKDEEPESTYNTQKEPDVPVEYGVDVSFPIHHNPVSTNYPWLSHNADTFDGEIPEEYEDMVIQPLGDRQEFYNEYIGGCLKKYGKKGSRCTQSEDDRVEMSLRQPQSMQNYTNVGFKKIKAPEKVWNLIENFWEKNKDNQKPENWGVGNTYTNNWVSPTSMVSVEDTSLRGGGSKLKQKIWDAARDVIQEWTGQELTQCSLYGIRIYKEGAVLATHVDRLPLVSSAIINVAQDLDEPWPLEVYGHDGKATNVTMEPGDMVLYESHSVLHGRPFPLKGRFMANLFVHFEPVGHSLRHNAATDAGEDVHEKYRDALKRGVSGHETDQDGLPPYVVPGTPEEKHWRRTHPTGKKSKNRSSVTGSTVAHLAAQDGDLDTLKKEVAKKKGIVNQPDENGWTPLHEGARSGSLEVVKYLFENGADINMKTNSGAGGTALYYAKQKYSDEHPLISYLESIGALDIGPDL